MERKFVEASVKAAGFMHPQKKMSRRYTKTERVTSRKLPKIPLEI
jgi:hypothetical protein